MKPKKVTLEAETTFSADAFDLLLEKALSVIDPVTDAPQLVRVRCDRHTGKWRVEYLAERPNLQKVEVLPSLVLADVFFQSEHSDGAGCGGDYTGLAIGKITRKNATGTGTKLRFSSGQFFFYRRRKAWVVNGCRMLRLLPNCSNLAYGLKIEKEHA